MSDISHGHAWRCLRTRMLQSSEKIEMSLDCVKELTCCFAIMAYGMHATKPLQRIDVASFLSKTYRILPHTVQVFNICCEHAVFPKL